VIDVLFTKCDERLSSETFKNYLSGLPEKLQEKILRFRRWQDRQAGLYGKLLVRKALTGFGYSENCLENVQYTKYGRPFLDKDIDINISHSEEFVVCSISENGKIGIDIEKIKPVQLSRFKKYIQPEKWEEIHQSDNKEKLFYDYWTMVESSLKADGRGLSFPLEEIIVHRNEVRIFGKTWYVTRLDICDGYSCSLATAQHEPEFSVSEVRF